MFLLMETISRWPPIPILALFAVLFQLFHHGIVLIVVEILPKYHEVPPVTSLVLPPAHIAMKLIQLPDERDPKVVFE